MGARILIVEDEEPLTLLLRYNLEAEGYEVDIAARAHRHRAHADHYAHRTWRGERAGSRACDRGR